MSPQRDSKKSMQLDARTSPRASLFATTMPTLHALSRHVLDTSACAQPADVISAPRVQKRCMYNVVALTAGSSTVGLNVAGNENLRAIRAAGQGIYWDQNGGAPANVCWLFCLAGFALSHIAP